MSAVGRLFREWLEESDQADVIGTALEEDLLEAFAAGWEARHNAHWVTSAVPELGVEGGEDRGPLDEHAGECGPLDWLALGLPPPARPIWCHAPAGHDGDHRLGH